MYQIDIIDYIENKIRIVKQTKLKINSDEIVDKLQEIFIKLRCFFECNNNRDDENLGKFHIEV